MCNAEDKALDFITCRVHIYIYIYHITVSDSILILVARSVWTCLNMRPSISVPSLGKLEFHLWKVSLPTVALCHKVQQREDESLKDIESNASKILINCHVKLQCFFGAKGSILMPRHDPRRGCSRRASRSRHRSQPFHYLHGSAVNQQPPKKWACRDYKICMFFQFWTGKSSNYW